ncbi:MAG: hypothetical protein MK136_17745, partial [Pirellulaceae bacterium]|nr:hypothetical protein [Pirellulaceae bacterium]
EAIQSSCRLASSLICTNADIGDFGVINIEDFQFGHSLVMYQRRLSDLNFVETNFHYFTLAVPLDLGYEFL